MVSTIFSIVVVLIPVYFLSLLILKKKNMGTITNRKFIALVPTVIAGPIVYVMVISAWVFSSVYYPKEPFDPVKWYENRDARYRMSNDIITSDMLMGKTKDEITALLGDDFYVRGKDMIGYYLGFVPGFGNIDPDVLVLYFEHGIVIKVAQIKT
jgi:hypothetical protein